MDVLKGAEPPYLRVRGQNPRTRGHQRQVTSCSSSRFSMVKALRFFADFASKKGRLRRSIGERASCPAGLHCTSQAPRGWKPALRRRGRRQPTSRTLSRCTLTKRLGFLADFASRKCRLRRSSSSSSLCNPNGSEDDDENEHEDDPHRQHVVARFALSAYRSGSFQNVPAMKQLAPAVLW